MRSVYSIGYLKEVEGQMSGNSPRSITFDVFDSESDTFGDRSFKISVHNSITELEADWRKLEQQSNISIYQRFDWIRAYLETNARDNHRQPLIITARLDDRLVFILPLMLEESWLRKIGWIGGSHSNYNLAVFDQTFVNDIGERDIRHLFDEITRMLGGFGYLKLCNQPRYWGGQTNPLLALLHQDSTNHAFGVDLSNGFTGVLDQGNAKRKRKKYRWQQRHLQRFGGAELVEAKDRSTVLEILNCFHHQKSERLQNMGVRDVFGDQNAQQFLRNIALESCSMPEPLLKLFALKIDGQYRAICGGGVNGSHFSAYFISFADDELAYISPGELLIYLMMEHLSQHGFQFVDMGCGEERYKQSWCPQVIEMVDIILPLSTASKPYVWLVKLLLNLRRKIRNSPLVWNAYKRTRMILSHFPAKSR